MCACARVCPRARYAWMLARPFSSRVRAAVLRDCVRTAHLALLLSCLLTPRYLQALTGHENIIRLQNVLKAENDLHCSNFESYQAQCQQEFAGWIAMNEQLEEEINEYKRADTVRACVRGTLSLHYTPALLCLSLLLPDSLCCDHF